MRDRQLTPGFSLALLCASDTAQRRGIVNAPPDELLPNLARLAGGLEQVQALLGAPIVLSSGYRSPELNAAVGGTASSQHCQGLAADFTCAAFGDPMDVARAIRDSHIVFDQCILEFGRWVHLSFSPAPRRRTLSIYDAKQGYLAGLCDPLGNDMGNQQGNPPA